MLDGGAGTDTLNGEAGADTLRDGETMNGGVGDDTYVLTAWQASSIVEQDISGPSNDALELPVAASAVTVKRGFNSSTGDYDDLILTATGLTGSIVVPKYFNTQDNSFKVETIRFSDGAVWTVADVFARDTSVRTTQGADSPVLGYRWADTLDGLGGNDWISGQGGNDQVSGGTGADTLYGGQGNDALYGNADNDVLYGEAGDDTLDGGAGNDQLLGSTGNDTYVFGRGAGIDTLTEESGTDRILLAGGVLPGDVTLFRNWADLILAIDAGSTQLAVVGHFNGAATQVESIEFADGTVWNAATILALTVAGTPNAMTGTAGNDTFAVDNAGDTIAEGVNQGIDTVQSSVTHGLGANLENLTLTGYLHVNGFGNTLDNVVTGNSGNNVLIGNQGQDTLVGGSGDDTLHANTFQGAGDGFTDSVRGGAGDDWYYVAAPDQVVELAGEGIDTVNLYADFPNYDLAANVENLRVAFTSYLFGIRLNGNLLNNVITADPLGGGYTLDGGAGADTLIAGAAGATTFYVDNVGDVVVSGGTLTAINTVGGVDTVISSMDWTLDSNLENLQLTGAATHGVGNSLNNILTGGGNIDVLEGMAGDDTYNVTWLAGGHDSVLEQAGQGNDTVVVNGLVRTYDLADYPNVENLTLHVSSGASGVVGSAGANRLVGNTENNVLSGGGGDDVLDYVEHRICNQRREPHAHRHQRNQRHRQRAEQRTHRQQRHQHADGRGG